MKEQWRVEKSESNMNYKRKRISAGLSAYTMSKELNVPYEKYLMVEKKQIPLEGSLLDKFQNALKNARMIKFNQKQKMQDIRQFIEKGELRNLMAERGYNGLRLSQVMNFAPSEISQILNNKCKNQERVEMVYDFLMNPINREVKVEDNQPQVDDFDYKKMEKIMRKKGIKKLDVAEALNIPYSSLCKYFSDRYKDSNTKSVIDHKKAIKEFIKNYSPDETPLERKPQTKFNSYQEEIEAIKQIKIETGKSYDLIAEEIGVSESHLSKILSGNRKITAPVYTMLKKYIDKQNTKETPQIERNILQTPIVLDVIETAENELKNDEIEAVNEQLNNETYIKEKSTLENDYYELLKENYDLKHRLRKAERQIEMYEKLIERL